MSQTGTNHKRLSLALLWFVIVCSSLAPVLAAEPEQAGKLNRQIKKNEHRLDKAEGELKKFDASIAEIQLKLANLRVRVRDKRQEIALLDQEIRQARIASEKHQHNLSNYLLSAFMMGQQAPLKLLLNQDEPAQAGRMMSYYRYFSEAHRDEVLQIQDQIASSETLQKQKQRQASKLESLLSQLEKDLAYLENRRGSRQKYISTLQQQQKDALSSLSRLQEDRKRLGSLSHGISKMDRPTTGSAVNGTGFAKHKGQLHWPVAGSFLARYGKSRNGSSQLRWQGVLISTNFGDEVGVVADGQVVFADWMRGFGYLLIVDHGGGYMTLYGHNEALLKSIGEQVKRGDTVALAGNSGRAGDPALYFEIRRRGEPVNPRSWMVARK